MSSERLANEGKAWDVLIIGAGPAGSKAAETAANGGASVLLVDRRAEIGVPVQCAEFLHRKVVHQLDLPDDIVAQEVDAMVTHVHGGEDSRMRVPGCILNRMNFDKLLVQRAIEAQAQVRLAAKVDEPLRSDDGGIIGAMVEGVKVMAKVIIGADGPNSTVGGWIGRRNKKLLLAVNCHVRIHEPSTETEVFLHPDFPGGYGWLFPKGESGNLGVGVNRDMGGKTKEALSSLWKMVEERVGPRSASVSGHIPVGGPRDMVKDNVILVGDAAGLTHPITGGGIHQAVECGALAGKGVAGFVNGDEGALDRYKNECDSIFGRSLAHAVDKRMKMESEWASASKDPEAFKKMMEACWIGHKGYNSR